MFPLAVQNVFGPPNRNCQKVKRVNAAANADLNPKHHRQAPHLGLRLHLWGPMYSQYSDLWHCGSPSTYCI